LFCFAAIFANVNGQNVLPKLQPANMCLPYRLSSPFLLACPTKSLIRQLAAPIKGAIDKFGHGPSEIYVTFSHGFGSLTPAGW